MPPEDWMWIEAATDLPYGNSHGLRSLAGHPASMTDKESAAHAALLAEYLHAGGARTAADDLRTGRGRARAFVTLDRDGSLTVCRGYVRPDDEPCEEITVQDGHGTSGW